VMAEVDPVLGEMLKRVGRLQLQERGVGDPWRAWEPTNKQKPFIEAVLHPEGGGHWENWACGSNRWGKTSVGAYLVATLARFGLEGPEAGGVGSTRLTVRDRATSGWVFGLDSNVLRDIIQPRLFDNGFVRPGHPAPFIPGREIAEWRPSDQTLRLKNGSLVGFKSCESPPSKATGAGLDYVYFDEPPPQAHYEEATIRVSGGRRLRIFATATLLPPEGGQVISWVYSDIIAPILEGRATGVGLFNASIYDNPHLAPEEIARLEARHPLGSLARRIRLNGDLIPGLAGAVVYGNFSRGVHVRALPPLSPYRPLCWSFDFNISPFCSTVWQLEPDLCACHDEVMVEDTASIDDLCDVFESRYGSWPHEVWIYGDAMGGHGSHQTGMSSYTLILNRLGHKYRTRMKVPAANPFEQDRVNAVNLALRDEVGATHVVIAPGCRELITDFEQVLADPRGGIKKSYNRQDPYSRRTHASDSAGYLLAAERPVRPLRQGDVRSGLRSPSYAGLRSVSYGSRR
jgi:phage terminase large subunit-like protein